MACQVAVIVVSLDSGVSKLYTLLFIVQQMNLYPVFLGVDGFLGMVFINISYDVVPTHLINRN